MYHLLAAHIEIVRQPDIDTRILRHNLHTLKTLCVDMWHHHLARFRYFIGITKGTQYLCQELYSFMNE